MGRGRVAVVVRDGGDEGVQLGEVLPVTRAAAGLVVHGRIEKGAGFARGDGGREGASWGGGGEGAFEGRGWRREFVDPVGSSEVLCRRWGVSGGGLREVGD